MRSNTKYNNTKTMLVGTLYLYQCKIYYKKEDQWLESVLTGQESSEKTTSLSVCVCPVCDSVYRLCVMTIFCEHTLLILFLPKNKETKINRTSYCESYVYSYICLWRNTSEQPGRPESFYLFFYHQSEETQCGRTLGIRQFPFTQDSV